ncbi:MAG: cytochrome-c oxidase, cbb3-type subunit I [Bdellovibrionales bacterium]|nr:cytochrome-c oxidase, cbb3-type subunit I [Bdellovibrionales bacterium]
MQQVERFKYDDGIVRKFTIATLAWALVAFLAGIYIAFEMAYYKLNFGVPYITFGRLRPLHTNAAVFAFAGNAIFAGIYYSMQRVLKTRLFSDKISKFHFWGWQLIIVSAALTLPFGFTQGKEYAELEWPIDIAITVVWVAFGYNMIRTILQRRVKHIYVAVWFYIATFVTVAVLHVVNSLSIPFSLIKSYPVYAGVSDALVQWWYGHNAVAFFLTTPFLGLMYYFIPKSVNRPVYSYRLSVVHFWTLVFIYIWAGPHHLLNTAVPDWAQTVGMAFSVMLWIPSWGGMINGLLTIRGAWDKVRTEPVVKFLAVATIFYGMATFEGPLLAIKSVSEIGHYTDWIIAHVHSGALGWNGFLSFGMIYYLVPKLWNTELYSKRLANVHFWVGTLGILLYLIAIYTAGITQGLMLREVSDAGRLAYPDFVSSVTRIIPLYWIRGVGGLCYLGGFIVMLYNVRMTVKLAAKNPGDTEDEAVPYQAKESTADPHGGFSHRILEAAPMVLTVLVVVAIGTGSLISLAPMFASSSIVEANYKAQMLKPYTALELAGRDIYVREGCYTCHSQMIRKTVSDVLRFGNPSTIEESVFDRPFQWGSRRIGPDLARVGSKYPDLWHYRHMMNPQEVVNGSIMPSYGWLFKDKIDYAILNKKLDVMKSLGVPYSENDVETAEDRARSDAAKIAEGLRADGAQVKDDSEILALISYLQRLGGAK